MAVYDLRTAENYNINENATKTSATGGASKFLNENLTTQSLQGVKLVGTRSNGDDVLLTEETLKKELERLVLKPYLQKQIGRIISNVSNNIVDGVWGDGYFEYILLDGRQIKKTDYPDLFNFFGVVDDVFNLPNFEGRYEKNKITGENRQLGSLQQDSLKSFSATSGNIQPTTQEHSHNISMFYTGLHSSGLISTDGGSIERLTNKQTDNATVIINPFTVTVSYSGTEFNEVKNVLKSSYLTAKVLI
jgi:hypothetical protein